MSSEEPDSQRKLVRQIVKPPQYSGALLARGYRGHGDADLKSLGVLGIWRHFTTRGHKGPVQCLRANCDGTLIVTGGADYSMRVWCHSSLYQAYALVGVFNAPVPPSVLANAKQPRCCWSPSKIDWAAEEKQGITAVHPTYDSEHREAGQTYRNGPILCGTGHGSFHAVDLSWAECSAPQSVTTIDDLHDDRINDICVLKLKDDGEDAEFTVITVGDDKKANLLCMKTKVVPRRELLAKDTQDLDAHPLINTLFLAGGGRRKREAKREESGLAEDGFCFQIVEITRVRSIEYDHPVIECQALSPHPNNPELVSFVCLTKRGLHLLNTDGHECIFLTVSAAHARKYEPKNRKADEFGMIDRSVHCDEHLSLATVYKKRKVLDNNRKHVIREQTLLFLVGKGNEEVHGSPEAAGGRHMSFSLSDRAAKKGRVGVWSIQDGVVGSSETTVDGVVFDQEHQRKLTERNLGEGGKKVDETDFEPLCVYDQDGEKLEIDQTGLSASFALQLRPDKTTVDIWKLEAVSEDMLVVQPSGPEKLLVCPGKEETLLQLSHGSSVCSVQVIDTLTDATMISGCEDGVACAWDLDGKDRGQISGEMRSLSAFELLYPPVEVVITAYQFLSFAFGASVDEDTSPPFFFPLDFHVEINFVRATMLIFIFVALFGIDEVMDRCVAKVYDSEMYRTSQCSISPVSLLLAMLSGLRNLTYLFVRWTSTLLVVPMLQVIAEAVHCVEHDGKLVVHAEPTLQCFGGDHWRVIVPFALLVPPFLFLLVPFAIVGGDALYVPYECLFDFQVWDEKNAWKKAAARKATCLHQAFLHYNPRNAFWTLGCELSGKILIPVIATVFTNYAVTQIILIAGTNFFLWLSSLLYAPYLDRKFCVLVQDTKLLIFCASATGCITTYLQDPHSTLPQTALGVFVSAVLVLLVTQLCAIETSKPMARVLPSAGPSTRTSSLQAGSCPCSERQPLMVVVE